MPSEAAADSWPHPSREVQLHRLGEAQLRRRRQARRRHATRL